MPWLHTRLCDVLDIRWPIIQAPIGSASCPELAAAVSNAGGLGTLALSWKSLAEVRSVIQETRRLCQRPFAVNLVLEWPQQDRLEVCLEEGIKIISFFWGDPASYISRIHSAGALVFHTVGSAEEARRCADLGVDVIVAQGWEAGGHVWGETATLPLLPAVVDAVAPLPVVAAGGIADGRGLAAALVLGAAGVWMGTRFLLSLEAYAHDIYKQRIQEARETDTFYSTLFDGGWANAAHRTLRSRAVQEWVQAGRPPAGKRSGEGEVVARFSDGRPVVRYSDVIPLPGMEGRLEDLALYAGQSAGLASAILPAAEIVQLVANQAIAALQRASAADAARLPSR